MFVDEAHDTENILHIQKDIRIDVVIPSKNALKTLYCSNKN